MHLLLAQCGGVVMGDSKSALYRYDVQCHMNDSHNMATYATLVFVFFFCMM